MDHGRPDVAQQTILSFLVSKEDRVFDVKVDGPAVQALASERLGRQISVRNAVMRLKESGHLHPLQAGRYAFTESPAPSARLLDLEPVAEAVLRRLDMRYYASWHSALWHYGLVDQQSRRVCVAVQRRKRPVVMGMQTVQFVFVSDQDKFFGWVEDPSFEWPVRIARPEKAIIDSFDRPRYAAPVPIIADALRRGYEQGLVDPERLVQDAIRFNSPHLNRRLGFFMDLYGVPGSDELALRLGRGYAISLDPQTGYPDQPRPPVNRRWRVFEDASLIGTALEPK